MFRLTQSDFSLHAQIDRGDVASIFAERKRLMAHWSKQIEQAVIEKGFNAEIYAGFQHLERIASVLPRYRQLVTVAKTLTIFGVISQADRDLSGMKLVALAPDDQLTQEWFLLVRHPQYTRALIAREIEPKFYEGIMTSSSERVERYITALKAHISKPTVEG